MNFQLSSHRSFSKSFSLSTNNLNNWQKVILTIFLGLFFALVGTGFAWYGVLRGNLSFSQASFKIIQPVPVFLSSVSFQKIPSIEVWKESVWLGKEVTEVLTQKKDQPDFMSWLLEEYDSKPGLDHTNIILEQAEKSVFRRMFFSSSSEVLSEASNFLDFIVLLEQEKEANKKYLVLFQNSDEIRATGGFIGSYGVLDFGKLDFWRIQIRDIYDPSGVSVTKESPLGHDQYLSGGSGMKLHDANWSPDFSTSSQDILWFFENIKNDPQYYDGVIAVNFSSVEKFLTILGDIYLADEKSWVKAGDIAEILRSTRKDFFPGNKEKVQKLSSLQSAIWLRVSNLSSKEVKGLVNEFFKESSWKEIQAFSKNALLQKEFEQLEIAGNLYSYHENEAFIFPIESNVGINKANAWVQRSLYGERNGSLIRLKTFFTNVATSAERPEINLENKSYTVASHMGYVNYYRIITSPNLQAVSVMVGDGVLTEWDVEKFIGSNGQEYSQIGFLVTVLESVQREVTIDFSVTGDWNDQVVLQKQAGVDYQSIPDFMTLVGFPKDAVQ